MDKKRLLESAEKFGIKVEFDVDNPGVLDENSGSFYTFEELLGDILPSEEIIDKKRIDRSNEILLNSYKRNSNMSEKNGYSFNEDEYKTETTNKYTTLSKDRWVA